MSEVSPEARRKQVIVAIIVGAIMGGVIWWLTTFWMWFPAGILVGLATGYLIKPPEDTSKKQ